MNIIFGQYSFKIKSVSPKELDIDQAEWEHSTFEIRQLVFHLFWLPFFSLGRKYVEKRKGKSYELPLYIINTIKLKEKVRTPWYAYFIPVALIVIILGTWLFITVAESIMRRNNYARDQQQYETTIVKVQQSIAELPTNAYLRLTSMNRYKHDTIEFLKLIERKKDTYFFQKTGAKFPKYSNETYSLFQFSMDTIKISKQNLNKMICLDYDSFRKRYQLGYDLFGDGQKYLIDAVGFFDGPMIDGAVDWNFWETLRPEKFQFRELFDGYKLDKAWIISLELQNFGMPAELVEIKNIDNQIKWMDSLPMKFKSYEYLKTNTIKGRTLNEPAELKFKSLLIFKDSLNKTYEYTIEGEKMMFSIHRK